ncbi:MAG: phage minor head protein [Flavipsychrobacter sp.]
MAIAVNRHIIALTKADKLFDRIAKEVYEGKLDGEQLDEELNNFVATHLMNGVTEGYGKGFAEVDYNTPDAEMMARLEQDVYWFSSAKTYNELVELNLALVDDSGAIRSFVDFKQAAAAIHDRYNVRYLQTEYNQAIASSQMAGKWVRIQEDKEILPLLRFNTVGDKRVRPEHAMLEGITKPVDDPFWDTYYPPLSWNCRCDVDQVAEGNITPDDKVRTPELPDVFKDNVGKKGIVYPKEHPYHELPDVVDKIRINQKAAELLNKNTQAYHHLQSFKNGGRVEVHSLADKSDLEYNIDLSTEIARKGRKMRIRPHSTLEGVKNPEIEHKGLTGDFKETKASGSSNALQSHIKSAAKQKADSVWLYLTHEDLTINNIKKGLYASLHNPTWNKTIKKVMLIYKDFEVVELDRKEIANWSFVKKLREP